MIENRNRTYTEKTTSVEQDIEVTQKGIITFVPVSGKVFGIPTTIEDVRFLSLMPMSAVTAESFGGSLAESWYCDLSLHYASGVSTAFASIASGTLLSEVGRRVRISATDLSLYLANASLAVGGASNAVVIASSSAWKLDTRFASNAKRYLMVTIGNSASVHFKTKKQTLAYEVKGYLQQ
jgi:hypothetical protein